MGPLAHSFLLPARLTSHRSVNSDIQSNFQVNEVLNTVITPTGGNSNLEQKYSINNKEYYYSGNLVLYQAYKDLTVGENSSGQVFVQLYMNVCVRPSLPFPILSADAEETRMCRLTTSNSPLRLSPPSSPSRSTTGRPTPRAATPAPPEPQSHLSFVL